VVQWKPVFVLELFGSRGYGLINGLGRKYGGSEVLTIGLRKKDGTVIEKEIICNPDADNSLRLELQNFVRSIKNKKQSVPGGQDALKVLKLVEKFYRQAL
jgi:predicted dehydrogenase